MKWKLILAMIAGLMVIDPACGEELIKSEHLEKSVIRSGLKMHFSRIGVQPHAASVRVRSLR